MSVELRLEDLGERRLIREILAPRYVSDAVPRFGDDCAFVANVERFGAGTIVATTDPCPDPMSRLLGFEDYYYDGWLLATINLSDLAATGARPLGLLTSLRLPNTLALSDLGRLLDGLDRCCAVSGTRVLGGNLKEGPTVDLSATAIGFCHESKCLSRSGALEGDRVVVFGELGHFWAGVFAVRENLALEPADRVQLLRNILTPTPKVNLGQLLANSGLVRCCIDNSDGLYPSLLELSIINGVQILLRLDDLTFDREVVQVSYLLEIDPVRLALGWGDWQLVACVSQEGMDSVAGLARQQGIGFHTIGEVRRGSGVLLERHGKTGAMIQLDSQRFTRESWFSAGLDSYIQTMITDSLLAPE